MMEINEGALVGIPYKNIIAALNRSANIDSRKGVVSIIAVGSSIKNLRKELSDIDLRIVVDDNFFSQQTRNVVRTFVGHVPLFAREISLNEIDTVSGKYLSGFLWQTSPITIIFDRNNVFKSKYENAIRRFKLSLNDFILNLYIEFRSNRNQYISSMAAESSHSTPLLASSLVQSCLELYSLLKSEPYPYKKWLVAHSRDLSRVCKEEALIEFTLELLTDYNPYQLKCLSEYFDRNVTLSLGKSDPIERWWSYLTLESM